MSLLIPSSGEYNSEFYGAWLTGLAQSVDAFNEASNMAISLGSEDYIGSFYKDAGYDRVENLITRRNVEANGVIADSSMDLAEIIGVDLANKIGPVTETEEAFKRRGRTVNEMAQVLGQQASQDFLKRALDQIVAALIGTTSVGTALTHSALAAAKTNQKHLLSGMRMFGDKGREVTAYLMNSEAFYDLTEDKIDNYTIDTVAGVQIVNGPIAGALGKPIIVVDVQALKFDAGAGDKKNRIFALMTGSASALQRGDVRISVSEVTDRENLSVRFRGEYNYLVKMLGYAWNTASGINPTDAALATPANWLRVFDPKLCGAAQIVSEGTDI